YFHFLQPNTFIKQKRKLTEEEVALQFCPECPGEAFLQRGYPKLIEAGQELVSKGVSFTDLTGLFEEETGRMYADRICHFTGEGNDLILKSIARTIVGEI